MWRISIEQKMARQIDVLDYVRFINDVINNRREQVKNAAENHGMIFYLWFDRMASQLRFNLISDIHEELPFQCELEVIENIEPILEDFLESPFYNGLPINGCSGESNEKLNALKVYRTELYK